MKRMMAEGSFAFPWRRRCITRGQIKGDEGDDNDAAEKTLHAHMNPHGEIQRGGARGNLLCSDSPCLDWQLLMQ